MKHSGAYRVTLSAHTHPNASKLIVRCFVLKMDNDPMQSTIKNGVEKHSPYFLETAGLYPDDATHSQPWPGGNESIIGCTLRDGGVAYTLPLSVQ